MKNNKLNSKTIAQAEKDLAKGFIPTRKKAIKNHIYKTTCPLCNQITLEQYRADEKYDENHNCIKMQEIIRETREQGMLAISKVPANELNDYIYEVGLAQILETTEINLKTWTIEAYAQYLRETKPNSKVVML